MRIRIQLFSPIEIRIQLPKILQCGFMRIRIRNPRIVASDWFLVYPPPPPVPGGGRHTRLRERGWGSSNSDERTDNVVTLGTNVLCAGDPQHWKNTKSVLGEGTPNETLDRNRMPAAPSCRLRWKRTFRPPTARPDSTPRNSHQTSCKTEIFLIMLVWRFHCILY
jgi:hypothetical protein